MFRDLFVQLAQKNNASLYKVAKDTGIPKSIVYEWAAGKREPSSEHLIEIAKYFNVTTDYLLCRTDDPTPPGSKKTTFEGEDDISDEDIKFALSGGDGDITDAQFEEVKQFVRFIRERDRNANK